MESTSKLSKLNEQPKKPNWPKYLMLAIPILLIAALGRVHIMEISLQYGIHYLYG